MSNRRMLQFTLEQKGFFADQVENGLEAVKAVQSRGLDHYHLILMDNVMPVMNGLQATSRLREIGYRNLLVGVTGNALETDVLQFEQAGADIVLSKPLRANVLNKVKIIFY